MATALRLWIGRRDTGIELQPDGLYPWLYRVRWPDDWLSPAGNVARAKSAAIGFARARGLGGTEVATWRRREIAAEASPAAWSAPAGGVGCPAPRPALLGLLRRFLAQPDPITAVMGTLRAEARGLPCGLRAAREHDELAAMALAA
jgi:hypothetical protein